MLRLLAQRAFTLVLTLFATTLVVFAVMQALPGDPASIILGVGAREDTLDALRAELGLDRPWLVRYADWLGGLLRGDLGRSHTYDVPVADLVAERLVVSGPLALIALFLSTAIALPVGAWSAARRGSAADASLMAGAQIGVAIPNFWFAMLLVLLFAVEFGLFPSGGFPGWDAGLGAALEALALPALALALPQAAILARVTRSAVIEQLEQPYGLTVLAKGVSPRALLWRHALPNALAPIVTIIGLQFAFLLAGAIIIENVFYLPGLGRLIFQAIAQRDLVTVQSLVVLLAATVVIVNFLVDVFYIWLDPRLQADG